MKKLMKTLGQKFKEVLIKLRFEDIKKEPEEETPEEEL